MPPLCPLVVLSCNQNLIANNYFVSMHAGVHTNTHSFPVRVVIMLPYAVNGQVSLDWDHPNQVSSK